MRVMLLGVALLFWAPVPAARAHNAQTAFGALAEVISASPPSSIAVTTTADVVDGQTGSFGDLTNDPGPDGKISLREAILASNNTPSGGALTIDFAIPDDDPGYSGNLWTIAVSPALGGLPLTRGAVIVDGTNDSGMPSIVVDGGYVDGVSDGVYDDGLIIYSSENRLQGLIVQRFFYSGIVIGGPDASNNTITNCASIGNGDDGVLIDGAHDNAVVGSTLRDNGGAGVQIMGGAHANTIGGANPDNRNIISGNTGDGGVYILGTDTRQNTVAGNWVGVSPTGEQPLPNGQAGVRLDLGAHHNTIGGPADGAGNVISGNDGNGISIAGSYANTIAGNLIGLAPNGDKPLPNQWSDPQKAGQAYGILISLESHDNTIGGVGPGARNVIASNNGHGIYIIGSGSNNNRVQGNYIGVDRSGVKPGRGNIGYGVLVGSMARNNLIGGPQAGAGNVITYNGWGGIRIDGNAPDNLVAGNLIGVGADRVTRLGNSNNGVRILGDNNTVGPGNVIANNSRSGIVATGKNTVVLSNTIQFNTFSGIDLQGSTTSILSNTIRANGRLGVCVSGPYATVSGNEIVANGGTSNPNDACSVPGGLLITGTQTVNTLIRANTIRANTGAGVTVWSGRANRVLSNSISENTDAGIRLKAGGNDELPPPTIRTVSTAQVAGTGCAGCWVEIFFDNGNQGEYFAGTTIATSDGTFVLAISPEDIRGTNITATLTDKDGNTSPFSASVRLPSEGTPQGRRVFLPVIAR